MVEMSFLLSKKLKSNFLMAEVELEIVLFDFKKRLFSQFKKNNGLEVWVWPSYFGVAYDSIRPKQLLFEAFIYSLKF